MINNSKRKVAICGRINNSGIVEVPEGVTLAEIIELAGGILDKKDFKGAHVGVPPYGRFLSSCPVDAITAGDNTLKFIRDLSTPNKLVITQMAPAARVAIGEAFGFEVGENVEHKLAAGLRKLGVDYVFDTTWAADLTIMEEVLIKFFNRLNLLIFHEMRINIHCHRYIVISH